MLNNNTILFNLIFYRISFTAMKPTATQWSKWIMAEWRCNIWLMIKVALHPDINIYRIKCSNIAHTRPSEANCMGYTTSSIKHQVSSEITRVYSNIRWYDVHCTQTCILLSIDAISFHCCVCLSNYCAHLHVLDTNFAVKIY